MTWRERIPTGRLGRRIRNGFIATALFAICSAVWHVLRSPQWDDGWHFFTWRQLFLDAPTMFLVGATVWQFLCLTTEWLYLTTNKQALSKTLPPLGGDERALRFWLRDLLRISVIYVVVCILGDAPTLVRYVTVVNRWPLYFRGIDAVNASLVLTIVLWVLFDRRSRSRISSMSS
jgi:hypothetical protein